MTAYEFSELPENCTPEIVTLYKYWQSIHPASGLPGRQHFDPVKILTLLPNIWMLDVYREPMRFRFRLIGTAITAFTGRDCTGLWCDEVYEDYGNTDGFRCASACVLRGKPQYRRSRVLSNPELWHAMAEKLYLPLASNGREVDILLNMTQYLDREMTANA